LDFSEEEEEGEGKESSTAFVLLTEEEEEELSRVDMILTSKEREEGREG
jgi:hypothetical protein